MKWFTDAVYSGVDQDGNDLPDDAFAQATRAYKEHVASIEHRLSPEVRDLANVYMHDAVPKKVKAKFPRSLALGFEVLEPPSGPRRPLELTYRRWDIGSGFGIPGINTLMEWGGERFQVLNHEVDIAKDGRYIHRLLFWPAGELVVLFHELSIAP